MKPSEKMTVAEAHRLLSTKEVKQYIGCSSTPMVWDYVKQGLIPQPRYIKAHTPRWQLGVLVDHLYSQLKEPEEVPRGIKGNPKPATKTDKSVVQAMRERLGL